jgi:hypothetical protein
MTRNLFFSHPSDETEESALESEREIAGREGGTAEGGSGGGAALAALLSSPLSRRTLVLPQGDSLSPFGDTTSLFPLLGGGFCG